jgi:hypothetical protein
MEKLSSGEDATLGNYRKIVSVLFGEDSEAVKFLDEKIAESPNGEKEEVIAAESQMLYLLSSIHFKEK